MATRAEIAIAVALGLIEDRARWPAAPLIGAGANWLKPNSIATLADQMAESDAVMTATREALQPMGVLDALGILDQHAEYIAIRAAELRELGQGAAAMALEAESALDGTEADRKCREQFESLAAARVKAERSDVPAWIDGGVTWTAAAVRERWDATDEELDELGPAGLDQRLDAIELAQRQVQARLTWLRQYQYPVAVAGQYDTNPPGVDMITTAANAGAELARVHGDATRALGRSRIPTEWDAAEITRRLSDFYALRAPAMMMAAMTREKPVRVIERPSGLVDERGIA